jgi:hypothetical protein
MQINIFVIPSPARDPFPPSDLQFLSEILPFRIHGPDEFFFLLPRPSFDLRFAFNRVDDVLMEFDVHETRTAVPLRETFFLFQTMLFDPSFDIVRHADVERAALARHDIDVEGVIFLASHI